MNRIIIALLTFLALVGCRTRKTTIEEQKLVQKERFIKYKDSTAVLQQNAQTLQLDSHALEEYEVSLESDRDSVGNSKELVYYRIRDGDSETIRVSGGKVKITAKNSLSNSLIEAKATLSNTISNSAMMIHRRDVITETRYRYRASYGDVMFWIYGILFVFLLVFFLVLVKKPLR
jgi:hypothetical protein